jgi:hypothetical protein
VKERKQSRLPSWQSTPGVTEHGQNLETARRGIGNRDESECCDDLKKDAKRHHTHNYLQTEAAIKKY